MAGLGAALAALAALNFATTLPAAKQPPVLRAMLQDRPASVERRAMTAAGAAARNGAGIGEASEQFQRLAVADPLNPQPFLFAGAVAQRAGQERRAYALFQSAGRRNPRLISTHYFLATEAFRLGDIDTGISELAILSRLSPNSVNFEQIFTAEAQGGANIDLLRHILARNPARRDALLYALAGDARNAATIAALSRPAANANEAPVPDWRARLVETLAASGDFAGARRYWAELGGTPIAPGMVNPAFGKSDIPRPFNWTFHSGDAGLIEANGGRLDVLYYNRSDALLAEQTMTLVAGRYRLSMMAKGEGAQGLVSWQIRCLPTSRIIGQVALAVGNPVLQFDVPSDCPAQRLELVTVSDGSDNNGRWTIGDMALVRVGP